jgi:uncharacterized repeat protein (TIGR03806 family)
MHSTRILCFVPLLFLTAILALPQTAPVAAQPKKKEAPAKKAPQTEFECRWAEGPIVIDGKADEPAWKNAQEIDDFYLPWLGKNARPAKTKTKAKLLWDRDYLYFFAEMEDHDLYADVKEYNGETWFNDVFELFFKPADDKPGYYEFQVNALGTKMNVYLPRRGAGGYARFRKEANFHMDAKVVLKGTLNKWDDVDEGWSVEGRIPWSDFAKSGGRPSATDKWKFALCRYDYSVEFEGPELSTCAPLANRDFHGFESYAGLTFLGPKTDAKKPAWLTKRVPLTTSTVVGSPDPPLPFRVERVFPKLKMNYPVAVTHIPGSDQLFYITLEQRDNDSVIRRIKDDQSVDQGEEALKLEGTVYDLAFHPQFAKNGFVYLVRQAKNPDGEKYCKLTRWTMSPNAPWEFDKKSEKLILEWASNGHNGSAVVFGLDGMLYITSGDGTSDSDTNVTGQRMDLLLSKLLRIDVDHPEQGKEYSVPKDNPFVGMKDIRPETWAYGFRNPWRVTCDKKTGHIWVGNNGQDLWEQAYFVRKGDNFGWSVFEGSHPFYLERKLGPTPHTMPALEHPHSEARSLTGGVVYYGSKYPELLGAYIYGDYSTGRLWAAKHDGTKVVWHKELAQSRLQIAGFGVDAHGELLIVDHNGKNEGGLYTLVPTPKDVPPSKFPKKLSDSGLFESVKGHRMRPALIPYSVNAPLWSDGAFKERWLGLPGADSQIEFNHGGAWEFPDQTVLVKSFALELEEGKPASRRWVETRFLTKQEGEWHGYSYVWNDEQTEGTLVEAKGLDREYKIKTNTGERTQKWRYPSRSECMVCHSRAAKYVLGLSEVQMNKAHDYGEGFVDNQLRVLDELGLFKKFDKGPFAANKFKKLADPYDKSADLNERARAYLHSNCAHCHVEAGGGNALFDVSWRTSPDKMKLINVKPVHHTFKLPEAQLVAPGHPERSVLLHRVGTREAGFMPPLATFMVDKEAAAMLREWIEKMPMPARKDD